MKRQYIFNEAELADFILRIITLHEQQGNTLEDVVKMAFTYAIPQTVDYDKEGYLSYTTKELQALYHLLPQQFKTTDAISLGNRLGVTTRTIERFLSNIDYFNRVRQGEYEKQF